MQLANIDIGKLFVSKTNMRHAEKNPDVADLLPSIRQRGVIVPLVVRPGELEGRPEMFGIVAGSRRRRANEIALSEGIDHGPLPCAIMEDGDDAAALEASLIENIQRLDPDEVSQWETFTRLIQKEKRSVEDVCQTFGVTELYVRRILALGNLSPRIRKLYRDGDIDTATIRYLTLASKGQQKDWLALYDDPEQREPNGQRLKIWLLGGESIAVEAALFDLSGYKGRTVTDLFGEGGYFADAGQFWQAQNEAIAAKRDAYLADGWADVEVMEPGAYFHSWEYEKTPKAKGEDIRFRPSQRHGGNPRRLFVGQGSPQGAGGGEGQRHPSRPAGRAELAPRNHRPLAKLYRPAPPRRRACRAGRSSRRGAAADGHPCHCRFAAVEPARRKPALPQGSDCRKHRDERGGNAV